MEYGNHRRWFTRATFLLALLCVAPLLAGCTGLGQGDSSKVTIEPAPVYERSQPLTGK